MKVLLARETQCGSKSMPSRRKEGADAGGSGESDRPDPGRGQGAAEETAAPCGVDLLRVQIPNHQKPS
jgi:hypothetical protein